MTDQEVKTVSLNDLRGLHMLSAVDFNQKAVENAYGVDDMRNAISFVLDGVTYTAYEDESDGYRSYLDAIIVSDVEISNQFEPTQVYASYSMDESVLAFYDTITNDVVLEVGTDHSDSYYPSFVYRFLPENLAINREVEEDIE
jgi:hypothetical protein